MYHILQEHEVMGLPISPCSILREYCRSASERDPVGNYRLLRLERPEEYFMRSFPLGERLIAVPGSHPPSGDGTSDSNSNFQVQQKKHNLRIRGSLHASGSHGNFTIASRPSSFNAAPKGWYNGYAFSEDENIDSDVEAASSRSDLDQVKSIGAHPSIKKVLKSVVAERMLDVQIMVWLELLWTNSVYLTERRDSMLYFQISELSTPLYFCL
ncbi:hypothetical protein PsorP6_006462 [Peronosclerospora sorghi]|uniref:Uncharacterized protein n=1 Tax=Peronosclerospora sorghi TaxID=230839 RepID=A0ACC0W554_9STRA|nr:hypothetical protein PsorP6_006462 [Peronosclerospora sorghi]